MEVVSLPSHIHRKQTVVIGDRVLSVLDRPNGTVISQWRFEEIYDIAYLPALRTIGGKRVDKPAGEIRIARNDSERRMGYDMSSSIGVAFDFKFEHEAFKLFQVLKNHPQIQHKRPTHLATVETEKFVLTLNENDLVITRRLFATTFKQLLDTAITNADIGGEVTVDLNSISGVKITPASHDKISFGYLSGRLFFITSLDTATTQYLGSRHQGELELDFSKSSEPKVRAFISEFEAQRRKIQTSKAESDQQTKSSSISEELKELAELHTSGALTDEEFASAKAKLLGN